MKKEVNSVLHLDKLVFEKIEFKRTGMKNNTEIEFRLQVVVNKKQDEEVYKVTLILAGNKEKEYTLDITLSGFFSFNENEELDENFKKSLINKNAVAIIMPYMRSQVSLITAQPEVECVVMPPFNIVGMMEGKNREKTNA